MGDTFTRPLGLPMAFTSCVAKLPVIFSCVFVLLSLTSFAHMSFYFFFGCISSYLRLTQPRIVSRRKLEYLKVWRTLRKMAKEENVYHYTHLQHIRKTLHCKSFTSLWKYASRMCYPKDGPHV